MNVKQEVLNIVNQHEGAISAIEIIEKLDPKPTLQRCLSYLSQHLKMGKVKRLSRGRYVRI